MAARERNQNPAIGDTVTLRLFMWNSSNRANVDQVEKVEIYFLDPEEITTTNVDGRRLVETIPKASVTAVETGQYSVSVALTSPDYTIGYYLDVWTVYYEDATIDTPGTIEHDWELYPNTWYADDEPIVYDFAFDFRPNRLRAGSKRYLEISITPNVPTGTDLDRYYTNLAIAASMKISMEMACVECMPVEADLRLLLEEKDVVYREKCRGYYFLDTDDLDLNCGIYNIWFTLIFGDSTYISDKQQLQIF